MDDSDLDEQLDDEYIEDSTFQVSICFWKGIEMLIPQGLLCISLAHQAQYRP